MTTRDIVKRLRKEGHSVKVYERIGGGLRITAIDGQRFIGSKGNQRARAIVGDPLSLRQQAHAKRLARSPSNVRNASGWGFKKKIKAPLPSDLKKALRKAQRIWRKRGAKGSGGTITSSNVRYQLETYGEEEALKRISESIRYAEGYAYTENVMHLVSRIRREELGSEYADEWEELANYIEDKKDLFREEWISKVLEQLYSIDHGVSEEDIIKNIYEIIK